MSRPTYAIPVFKPWMTDLEVEAVAGAVRSNEPTLGLEVARFAKMLADKIGVQHVLPTCNGTAACFLAVAVHQFPPGSEIIIPEITFIATANACKWAGCVPVPVDVDEDTWCMNPGAVKAALTPRTVAIMPVHLYGCTHGAWELRQICQDGNLVLIEDACEALGSRTGNNIHAGGMGDTAAFSFYGNKTITTGEGGAFATSNYILMQRAIKLWGQGQTSVYVHPVMGYNLRMSNLNAALGCAQMSRLDEIIRGKEQVARWYKESLRYGREQTMGEHDLPWASVRLFANRDHIAAHLAQHGIETRPVFPAISSQRQYNNNVHGVIATLIAERGLVLPSYAQMTRGDFEQITVAFDKLSDEDKQAERDVRLFF